MKNSAIDFMSVVWTLDLRPALRFLPAKADRPARSTLTSCSAAGAVAARFRISALNIASASCYVNTPVRRLLKNVRG